MRRALLSLLLGVAGCTWSNSLYRARHLAGSAERAERRDRPEEAATLWGQVAVKAESAYARNAAGSKGGEALWLRGRATARLGDCTAAIPLLDRAMQLVGSEGWSDALRLDLARCRSRSDEPATALAALEPLLHSSNEQVRLEARALSGRALVRAGRWDEALEALRDESTTEALWQRAIAAAHLGLAHDVLELTMPRIAANDTVANWPELLNPLAEHGTAAVDSLLTPLLAMPRVGANTRQTWQYAAAAGLAGRNPEASVQRMEALIAADSAGPGANSARTALATRSMAQVTDSASLAAAIARAQSWQVGGGSAAFLIRPMVRAAEGIMSDIRAHPAGATLGDLAFFRQAEIARDSLQSPQLADWLLEQAEQRWPTTPYLGKILLLRISYSPDSAAVLRDRLHRLPDSPYLRYLQGQEGREFAVLEDSLQRYLDGRKKLRPDDIDGPPQNANARTDFE